MSLQVQAPGLSPHWSYPVLQLTTNRLAGTKGRRWRPSPTRRNRGGEAGAIEVICKYSSVANARSNQIPRYFGGGKQSRASTSHDTTHNITTDSVPLPKLKKLLLHEVIFGPGGGKKYKGIPKNKLGNLVRDRKKAGHELQELAVQSCVGFGPSQVRECEKFVRKVVWDGDEGEDLAHGCTHHHHYWDPDEYSPNEEYDAHYQIYGRRDPWDTYDSDGLDDYLPYF